MSDNNLILIGKVTSCHGIKGWVAISSFSSSPETIFDYQLYIKISGEIKKIQVEDYRIMPKKIIMKVSDINSIDDADKILNQDIFLKSNQLSELQDSEYYWYQLIGCYVYTKNNDCIGEVVDMMRQHANDILVIKKSDRESEILIPFIKNYLINVDLENKSIRVNWENDY
tara:strand:- start:795 stop:1304 length:510 start_codon:yes stop_codon:yes gene_type:complete